MIRRPLPGFVPLGRRLLAAFALVALSSVVVLGLAALIGTEQGVSAAQQADRVRTAGRAAAAVAAAYTEAAGWAGADLAPARAIAEGAGATLVVRDGDAMMMSPGHARANAGRGSGPRSGEGTTWAPVTVDSRQVGAVTLSFGPAGTTARDVAWGWVAGAGVVALALALAVSAYVSRQLTRPLVAMTAAARAFAAGDRGARSGLGAAPGELGELAVTFDHMADEVVHAERVRRHLSADVAHELRTPLAAVQAGLEELRDGLAEANPARLASLHDQTLRLGRIVDDLAKLSAAESAALSLRLTDVDLADIVTAAVDGQEPLLRAAGLHVVRDITGPIPIRVDADRIHQSVVNLLANAARYCRRDDHVSVRACVSDGAAVLRVADTGPGIDPQDLPHVFERLRRGHAAASVAGTGIGLAVVRELVTAHGGTVSVWSEPGQGATFTVSLPLTASAGPGGARPAAALRRRTAAQVRP